MSEISDALAEVWAANPVGVVRIVTLELKHSAFVDKEGNSSSIRLVNGRFDPITVTLETGAQATFQPGVFKAKLPKKGSTGQRSIALELDGASREVVRQLERVADAPREPIRAVLREYAPGDLSAPGQVHDNLTLVRPRVGPNRVTASAVFNDSINKAFPSILYTTATHPGLI